jgi:1-phosphatidylinositol phosphodiesterase
MDIRCCNKGSAFSIYHGSVDQRITFAQVIATIKEFLRRNPAETLIMSVKEENSQSGDAFNTLFNTYVAGNPGVFYLGSAVPTLGTVRGKIVLLRRFKGSGGIDASDWPDNQTWRRAGLDVEDYYNVPDARAKWDAVVRHLDAASSSASSALFITFTSGFVTREFGIPNIGRVSTSVNQSLAQYFGSARPGRYGIVIINFVDAALCAPIIATNQPRH